ncbi:MAG: hypothetical protein SGJ09_10710 [Phycisphaerae bacterium]|nr:hypothetical protein [Phycisphaerae bacterium]
MPIYEYVSESDGEVLELLRPMRDADLPVEDPTGAGRTFVRRQSSFGLLGGAMTGAAGILGSSTPMSSGGCCPCGKSHGQCGASN